MKYKIENYQGAKFPDTDWTVLEDEGYNTAGNRIWTCRCTCGEIKSVPLTHLPYGRTKSCKDCALRGRGSYYSTEGYRVLAKWSLDFPEYSNRKDGTILEHVYLMSCYLRRALTENETVNHINGIRDDNRLENLQLRLTNHGAGQPYICSDCGSDRIRAMPIADKGLIRERG